MILEEWHTEGRLLDFTAALFLRRPDPTIAHACTEASSVLGELVGDATFAELMGCAEAVPLTELQEDYDALFCVPVSGRYLAPFESAQRDKRLWGPLTRSVARFYADAGFSPQDLVLDAVWNANPIPDHIGFEMAFLSALLQSRARAGENAASRLRQTYVLFRREHFDRWTAAYGNQLAESADTPLYRALGALTAGLASPQEAFPPVPVP